MGRGKAEGSERKSRRLRGRAESPEEEQGDQRGRAGRLERKSIEIREEEHRDQRRNREIRGEEQSELAEEGTGWVIDKGIAPSRNYLKITFYSRFIQTRSKYM